MQLLKHARRRRDENGAAALEFALVVPILLPVLIGIVNFGFVFAQQISLNNAARQAVRYAVVDGRTCGQIKSEGQNSAGTVGMTTAPIPVVTNCGSDSSVTPCKGTTAGTNITVTMTGTGPSHEWAVTAPPFNFIPVPTLQGTGVMRCEFS
ncbi:TadE/TadG family type IV pilus assembly protein [Nocardioides sp. B-3]|uniref:TadE/TadG family type IV pilus assembly protein n=1 Tax=Nocardioides sp. B-3 TaxID=2895565 RepID=UPI0021521F0D|nr:TadE/TadG family type IV pilus assembly protein [Nocardioides sp. B-3]UUZ59708.1 pilus assembly protein [Nocardioides sp. B-3]